MKNDDRWDADVHPLMLTRDAEGGWHFYSEIPPLRTTIPSDGFRSVIARDDQNGTATIVMDGKTVIYDRIAYDLAGNWICDLRIGQKRGIEG